MKLNKKQILILCAKNEITQKELAKRCNIAQSTLSMLMNGKSTTAKTLMKIATYFNVDVTKIAID